MFLLCIYSKHICELDFMTWWYHYESKKVFNKKSVIVTNKPTLFKLFWQKEKQTRHSNQICSISIKYIYLGPSYLGKYKSSEWLLEKLTICFKKKSFNFPLQIKKTSCWHCIDFNVFSTIIIMYIKL